MKIAIIGGGISGLATYLQLQKAICKHPQLQHAINISILESHELKRPDDDTQENGLPSLGSGYGLAANGMKSLRRLDPAIYDKILHNSFPTPRFQMKTRQGWTLGAIPCVIDNGVQPETCCMVTREVVLQALREQVPSSAISIRKVAEVCDGEEQAIVEFADGERVQFDLVVGADGIWSRARKAILGDNDGPEYRGLSTVGGFIETKHLDIMSTERTMPYPHSQTIMTFGHNGFLGYSPCRASQVDITADHIRGNATVRPGELAFWWARSAQKNPEADPDIEATKQDLAKRMKAWKDPNIGKILQHGLKTTVIPTYALPKQKTWAGKRVVLVGDAAHALPSSSGQGVSQSLEDAEALALLLAHNLSEDNSKGRSEFDALRVTFEQYMTVRKAHVERILDVGNRGGDASRDQSLVAEYVVYAFLWIMLRFFSRFLTREIENYDLVQEVGNVLER